MAAAPDSGDGGASRRALLQPTAEGMALYAALCTCCNCLSAYLQRGWGCREARGRRAAKSSAQAATHLHLAPASHAVRSDRRWAAARAPPTGRMERGRQHEQQAASRSQVRCPSQRRGRSRRHEHGQPQPRCPPAEIHEQGEGAGAPGGLCWCARDERVGWGPCSPAAALQWAPPVAAAPPAAAAAALRTRLADRPPAPTHPVPPRLVCAAEDHREAGAGVRAGRDCAQGLRACLRAPDWPVQDAVGHHPQLGARRRGAGSGGGCCWHAGRREAQRPLCQ